MLLLLNYRKHLFQESFNIGVRHHNIYYLDLSVNILLKLKLQYFGQYFDAESQLTRQDPDAGKD